MLPKWIRRLEAKIGTSQHKSVTEFSQYGAAVRSELSITFVLREGYSRRLSHARHTQDVPCARMPTRDRIGKGGGDDALQRERECRVAGISPRTRTAAATVLPLRSRMCQGRFQPTLLLPFLMTKLYTADRVQSSRRRVGLSRILLLALIAVAACRADDVLPTRASVPAVALNGIAQITKEDRAEEANFVRLAETAPSSAGYFISEAGVFTVWVRDSSDDSKALAISTEMLSSLRPTFGRAVTGPEVRRARYTFAQLAAWRDALFANALTHVDGVTLLDLNEATNRVVVGVDARLTEQTRATVLQMLPKLGVDSAAVVFTTRNPTMSHGRGGTAARYGYSLVSKIDTIVGGVHYQFQWASNPAIGSECTIGIIVDYGGAPAMLSASHCSENSFAPNGDVAYQSVSSTDPRFANETVDAAGYTCGFRTCRGSDANIWALDSGVKSLQGLIAKTTYSTSGWGTSGSRFWDSSSPYFITTAYVTSITTGATVKKMGATTGYTSGTVTGTCTDINVPHTRTITCTTESSTYADLGDSGGPVFVLSGNGSFVYLAGIMGSIDPGAQVSYYSPVTRITANLGAMNVMRPITLTAPTISGSLFASGGDNYPQLTWSGVSGATAYDLYRKWYRYPSAVGSADWEYLGTVSSGNIDGSFKVDAYTGTTIPNFSTEGYVAYYLQARNSSETSYESTTKYFRLSPP